MIQPVNALAPRVLFKGQLDGQTPINVKTEKRLALINAGGISTAIGAATTIIARTYTSSWKHAGIFGIGAAAVGMLFLAPRFLYKYGINSYTKGKEADVFVKEKDAPKKILAEVNTAIEGRSASLSDKISNFTKNIFKKAA